MKNCSFPTAFKTIRCLIGQADMLRRKGRLIRAAKILKRADGLIKSAIKTAPEDKILLSIKTKHEKCWNKVIDNMAKRIY
jgi:hypothetical protein